MEYKNNIRNMSGERRALNGTRAPGPSRWHEGQGQPSHCSVLGWDQLSWPIGFLTERAPHVNHCTGTAPVQ